MVFTPAERVLLLQTLLFTADELRPVVQQGCTTEAENSWCDITSRAAWQHVKTRLDDVERLTHKIASEP